METVYGVTKTLPMMTYGMKSEATTTVIQTLADILKLQ